MSQPTGPDPNPEIQTRPGSLLRGGLHQKTPQNHMKHTHTVLYNVHRVQGYAGDRVVHERLSGEEGGLQWIDVYVVLMQISVVIRC